MWFKWAMYGFGHAFEPGIFVQRDDGFWFSSCLFFNFYFSERPRLTNHSFVFFYLCNSLFWSRPHGCLNKTTSQYIWKPIVDTCMVWTVVFCRHMSNSESCFFPIQNRPKQWKQHLVFPFSPTAPPRAWRAIENIMFHEVPVAGMVIFCLPLPVWNMERTSWLDSLFTVVCRSSIFISATWLNNFSDESIGNCRHLIACQCFLITCMPDCCLGSYLHTQGAQRSCVDCRA